MSFTVYKSSAGSGKTFTLVKEYLKLILEEPDNFRHILAITFTNKAANEMRERVLESLQDLSTKRDIEDGQAGDMMNTLVRELTLPASRIASQAGLALKTILHEYSDFSVGTIDSFSHRLIRTFAHDFGLPVNFNVELDSDELLTTAVDLLIDKVGEDPMVTDLLVQFLETRMEDEQDWNIDRIFTEFAKVLLDEEGGRKIENLKNLTISDFKIIASAVRENIIRFEKTIKGIARQAMELILDRQIPHTAFYYSGAISKYFEKLSQGDFKAVEPNTNVRKTVEGPKWTSAKAEPADIEKISEIGEQLMDLFQRIQKIFSQGRQTYYLFQAIARTIFPMAVLNEIGRLLDEFKKQNNIVHIAEFNKRISGIILNEPVPFIYERLGEKYRHLLIDEFQDTSVMQWQNLLPLVENALSAGYFNLVVGDGKQAIYRWRNGDVNQFVALPSVPGSKENPVLASREKVLADHYRKENLKVNFRSRKAIVDFNNELFTELKTLLSEETAGVYADHVQELKPDSNGGYVRIEFLPKEAKKQPFRELLYARILAILQDLGKENIRWQDIAILSRRNDDASDLAQFLISNQVDVVSSESLLIASSPEVAFLTGFIRFLNEPSNKIVCAELIIYLFRKGKIKSDGIHSLISGITSAKQAGSAFYSILKENRIILNPAFLRVLPAYDLLEEIIRIFGLHKPANPYLQFFLDHVLKYMRKNSAGIPGFLEWWEKQKSSLSIILPEGMNAVRIMTMHKAKGLQFPVVIVPFYSEKYRSTKRYLWVDLPGDEPKGLPSAMLETGSLLENTQFADKFEEEKNKTFLDNLNLLYVALTRPRERLYVFSPSAPEKSDSPASVPSFFRYYLKKKEIWSESECVYEFGDPHRKPDPGKASPLPAREMKEFISADWHGRVFVRKMAPSSWEMENLQKNRSWGNLVHDVLSRIKHTGDEDSVLDEYLRTGTIGEEEGKTLREKIAAVLGDSQIREFFAPGLNIRTEAEILDRKGNIYRPDRIIIDGKKAVVVDFKTGKPGEHQQIQLVQYGKLLTELGYEKVEKFLLYLEPEVKLVEVK
jgi:ATP-dependent exoDNAse (exonuclease V) beta subunit